MNPLRHRFDKKPPLALSNLKRGGKGLESAPERYVNVKSHVRNERHFIWRGRKSIILLEGSQAPPACLSDKGSVKVKTLEWLEAVA
jgi:hypothetical protein